MKIMNAFKNVNKKQVLGLVGMGLTVLSYFVDNYNQGEEIRAIAREEIEKANTKSEGGEG